MEMKISKTAEKEMKGKEAQIVRCSECIYSTMGIHSMSCRLAQGLLDIHGDSYCSYGKNKKDIRSGENNV